MSKKNKKYSSVVSFSTALFVGAGVCKLLSLVVGKLGNGLESIAGDPQVLRGFQACETQANSIDNDAGKKAAEACKVAFPDFVAPSGNGEDAEAAS